MKLSELIQALENLKEQHGDVEFEFDWDIGTAVITEEDVKLIYDSFSESYFLSFH